MPLQPLSDKLLRFPLKVCSLRSPWLWVIGSRCREVTRPSQNQREVIFYLPHPLPQGKDSFKQFPTPGTEGLDYPRGMVTGQIEPCIIEELKFQVFRLFRRAKVSVKRVKRARHAHEERRGKKYIALFCLCLPPSSVSGVPLSLRVSLRRWRDSCARGKLQHSHLSRQLRRLAPRLPPFAWKREKITPFM